MARRVVVGLGVLVPEPSQPVVKIAHRPSLASGVGCGQPIEEERMADVVRLEVEDGVGTIRLDRPPMNAIDTEVTRGLAAATEEATRRDDVGAVVIWGGEKLFAAGADVKEMLPMTPREVAPMIANLSGFIHPPSRPLDLDPRDADRLGPWPSPSFPPIGETIA